MRGVGMCEMRIIAQHVGCWGPAESGEGERREERGETRRTAVGGYTVVTGQKVYVYVVYSWII